MLYKRGFTGSSTPILDKLENIESEIDKAKKNLAISNKDKNISVILSILKKQQSELKELPDKRYKDIGRFIPNYIEDTTYPGRKAVCAEKLKDLLDKFNVDDGIEMLKIRIK